MKPVNQQHFGVPDGDCFSACVASILAVPLADVPHLPKQGYAALQTYLGTLGVQYLEMPADHEVWHTGRAVWPIDTYLILSGPSPNVDGVDHAVVGRLRTTYTPIPEEVGPYGYVQESHQREGVEMVHDPREGGKPMNLDTITHVGFFIRTGDPS